MRQFTLMERRGVPVEVRSVVTSTNSLVKQWLADQQLRTAVVMVADQQSAGHGKLNRQFYSAAGCGVYFTVGLPASILSTAWRPQELTIRAVVAVFQVASQCFGGKLSIKWVNDLYCGEKKAAGILAETALDRHNQLCGVVIGWGINLTVSPGWPPELRRIAGALASKPVSQQQRDQLADLVIDRFLSLLKTPWQEVLRIYQKNQYLAGRDVVINTGAQLVSGRFMKITADGYLQLQTVDGPRIFSDGTIRLQK